MATFILVSFAVIVIVDATFGAIENWRSPSTTENLVDEENILADDHLVFYVPTKIQCASLTRTKSSSTAFCYNGATGECLLSFTSADNLLGHASPAFSCHGFQAAGSIQLITVSESATTTLYSHSGFDEISSYENNLNIFWKLYAPEGKTLNFHVSFFDTESCCDCVKVYSGASISSPLQESICGATIPSDFQNTKFTVHFRTDASVAKSGFRIHVTVV